MLVADVDRTGDFGYFYFYVRTVDTRGGPHGQAGVKNMQIIVLIMRLLFDCRFRLCVVSNHMKAVYDKM